MTVFSKTRDGIFLIMCKKSKDTIREKKYCQISANWKNTVGQNLLSFMPFGIDGKFRVLNSLSKTYNFDRKFGH